MLAKILVIFQIILAVLLIGSILLQQKGSGIGSAFGGSSNIYSTKRGVDKMLFNATIIISILFFLVALANLVV
ncbi:MAG TPA: preprotein translocase subunit SecG [Candidatus Magasanikbacteria bacterium]|nr:preprotein translocase subunit SecG [Candidatus Magasanikbacteria bacterium]